MKKAIAVIFFILFVVSCASTPPEPVNQSKNEFEFIGNHQAVSVMPTYRYIGKQDFSDDNVMRVYHIWRNDYDGKVIMLYHIIMKQGTFPNDVQWIDRDNAIFVDGMRVAYNYVAGRAKTALNDSNITLPECLILAQEIHIGKDKTEAILRMLITPDDMCAEQYWKTLDELDRVTITNPLGE